MQASGQTFPECLARRLGQVWAHPNERRKLKPLASGGAEDVEAPCGGSPTRSDLQGAALNTSRIVHGPALRRLAPPYHPNPVEERAALCGSRVKWPGRWW